MIKEQLSNNNLTSKKLPGNLLSWNVLGPFELATTWAQKNIE
jgi:hypothetical protein